MTPAPTTIQWPAEGTQAWLAASLANRLAGQFRYDVQAARWQALSPDGLEWRAVDVNQIVRCAAEVVVQLDRKCREEMAALLRIVNQETTTARPVEYARYRLLLAATLWLRRQATEQRLRAAVRFAKVDARICFDPPADRADVVPVLGPRRCRRGGRAVVTDGRPERGGRTPC
jgi:hypothetical protein